MSRSGLAAGAGRAVLACLLILAGSPWEKSPTAAALLTPHRSKLYNSSYFSLHKTTELPQINLSPKEALDTIIATRSFNREIIITVFTSSALRWMIHYAKMAQALGFDHFLVVGDSSESCTAFRERWCAGAANSGSATAAEAKSAAPPGGAAGGDPLAGCMASYPGCGYYGEGLSEAWVQAGYMVVERLWLYRYHLAAELARRGINVLMSDLDVVIHGDFYSLVKSEPLNRYQFFQMPGDYYPNGGLWYIQNAHPRGQVVRWIEAAVQRSLTVLAMRRKLPDFAENTVRYSCSWTDQDVLKYVLASMAYNRSWDQWSCLHEAFPDTSAEWAEVFGTGPGVPAAPKGWVGLRDGQDLNPPWEHLVTRRDQLRELGVEELYGERFMHPPHARSACLGAGECARLAAFVLEWGRQWIAMEVPVVFPPGFGEDAYPLAPAEVAAGGAAPPLPLPPVPEREWVLHSPVYLFHDARVMWSGWATPRPQPWGMVTHLVAFGKTWGRETGGRGNRMHLVQALGLWHAPAPTPERILRVSQPLARAAAAQPTDAAFRRLVHAVMVAAAITGRAPVLPAAPCGVAPWMRRSELTLHGFDDPHFVAYLRDVKEPAEGDNVMCAPYLSRSANDLCTDEVVLSEFHLDHDLMYPSYTHETATLEDAGGEGAGTSAAAAAAVAAAAALRAAAQAHAGARVLFLSGGLESVLALAGAGSAEGDPVSGALQYGPEMTRFREFVVKCPDFLVDESLAGKDEAPGS